MPILGVIASSFRSGAADTGAMFPLQVITVGAAGASSVTFSNIPNTYEHLQLRILSRCTRASASGNMMLRINSDTGSNYANHEIYGDGASATASGASSVDRIDISRSPGTSATANIFSGTVIDILDYANTNKYKTVRSIFGFDNNSATVTGYIGLRSGLWMNTNAITTVEFTSATSSSFTVNSVFALYGIKGAA